MTGDSGDKTHAETHLVPHHHEHAHTHTRTHTHTHTHTHDMLRLGRSSIFYLSQSCVHAEMRVFIITIIIFHHITGAQQLGNSH